MPPREAVHETISPVTGMLWRLQPILAEWRGTVAILLWATLITSVLHFADNAFRLDLYPGPAWLTPNLVLLA